MTTARPTSSEQFFREVTSVPQAQQPTSVSIDFDDWGNQESVQQRQPAAPTRPVAQQPSRSSSERVQTTTSRFEEAAEYDEAGAGADEFEYEDFEEGNFKLIFSNSISINNNLKQPLVQESRRRMKKSSSNHLRHHPGKLSLS